MAKRTVLAALLRGVNVGGKNRVPMKELIPVVESLGHEEVVTYIQSGNLALSCATNDPRSVEAGLETAISERFGLTISVIARTHAELVEVARRSPFLAAEPDPSRLHVVFLQSTPTAAAFATLDPDRSPGDRFHANGRELYLHVPHGSGNSKLTLDYFERRLGVVGTARNWNTLLRLVELTRR